MKGEEQPGQGGKSMKSSKTRVLLADDHAAIRSSIKYLLERSDDVMVVGEATNGRQALELADQLEPDVLLVDVEMPQVNGIQVTNELAERFSMPVLAVSAHDDAVLIQEVLKNGAAGYVTKDEAADYLLLAVREVVAGERHWVSQQVAERLEHILPV